MSANELLESRDSTPSDYFEKSRSACEKLIEEERRKLSSTGSSESISSLQQELKTRLRSFPRACASTITWSLIDKFGASNFLDALGTVDLFLRHARVDLLVCGESSSRSVSGISAQVFDYFAPMVSVVGLLRRS